MSLLSGYFLLSLPPHHWFHIHPLPLALSTSVLIALAVIFDQALEEESKVFERESSCSAKNHLPISKIWGDQPGHCTGLLQLDECWRNPEIL